MSEFAAEFAAEFAGCVWTEAVPGKKKLRIEKYPDTCGRGVTYLLRVLENREPVYMKHTNVC